MTRLSPATPPSAQRVLALQSCTAKGGCAVLRSTRGVALLTLALINVFTLAAGVTLVITTLAVSM